MLVVVLSPTELELARRVCTDRQYHLLRLAQQGHGARAIALALNLDRSTVRSTLTAARRNIARALELEGTK